MFDQRHNAETILIFTKPDCPKCKDLKKHLPKSNLIEFRNISTPDDLALASFYEITQMDFPIMVYGDEILPGPSWITIKNRVDEILNERCIPLPPEDDRPVPEQIV